jgi:hypothetical protein
VFKKPGELSEEEIAALVEKARSTERIQRVVSPGATLAWLVIFSNGRMRQAYSA